LCKSAITSAASGNTSNTAPVTVKWAYDLPTTELTSQANGFAINGRVAGEQLGSNGYQQGSVNIGDVNGDSHDDFALTNQAGTTRYIVYGRQGLATLELSTLEAVGNTNGFIITNTSNTNTTAGDVNGDGLNDLVMGGSDTSYVVFGRATSPGLTTLAALVPATASTSGYRIAGSCINYTTHYLESSSVVKDVNGDGFDDILFNYSSQNSFLMFGSASVANTAIPTAITGTFSNGFFIDAGGWTSGGKDTPESGDFNGDGYGDFLQVTYDTTTGAFTKAFVLYGGSSLSGISLSSLNAGSSSRGFTISGVTDTGNLPMTSFLGSATGDINGDGLDDIIFNDGTNTAYVIFGKTDSASINLSAVRAGSGGFVINGTTTTSGQLDVDVIGDFNGDGLADMILGDPNMRVNNITAGGAYVVYGRTGTGSVTMTNLAHSEGFRIDGGTVSVQMGMSVSAAGDVNGDGFADLIVSARNDSPDAGRAGAGISRLIYGGVDKLESMTFQAVNGDAIGTTGADNLVGTTGANQIVAGDGNDTLVGAGGADVLHGGRGNDTIALNASNIAALAVNSGNASQAIARIDGGSGTDTLEITASLDLNAIRPTAIQSIERINMSASGTSLTMGLLDVLGLSEKNNPFNTATGWTATSTGGATGWGTVNVGAQVVVDGTNTNDLYLSGNWQSIGTVQNTVGGVTKTYKVLSDLTKAEAQVLVDSNVKVHLAPTILTTANELPNTLNMTEASDGTLIKLSLIDTDAASGHTITLNWGGQTISVTLTATDISNGYVNVPVTLTQLTAETPSGTSEAVAASVTLLSGSTVVAQSGAQAIDVNFVLPTAPTINSAVWAATGAGNTSALAGIPEALNDRQYTAFGTPVGTPAVDNQLYYSEAVAASSSGTIMRVQLPTAGVTGATNPALAGDTLTVTWGDQTLTAITLVAANITAKYVDITVPYSAISTQPFGTVAVTAVVTSALSGNFSPAATVNVNWAYDLPLADLTALGGGFAINGGASNEKVGYSGLPTGAVNVGDVNGDGYDDVMISETGTNRYVVYGRPGLTSVELSSMSVAGNTNGFTLTGGGPTSTRAGDINGDGLNDIVVMVGGTSAYVVYGSTASIGKVALTALAASSGFKINYVNTVANTTLASPSLVGDVNGDGYDDILFNFADASGSGNFLLYGGSGLSNMTLPSGVSGTASNGFFITPATTTTVSGGQVATMSGDFNGDGYSDFVLFGYSSATALTSYVYFGGSNLTGVNSTSLNTAGNGRGFSISGLTSGNTAFFGTNAGDINGDGMEDMIFNDGSTRAYVLFGKTDTSPVNVSALAAGNGGFIINAGNSAVTSAGYLYDVDAIGDFNGDGLVDMVVADHTLAINGSATGGAYVVYGRTSTAPLTLNNLAASEGFRIDGAFASSAAGYTSTSAGDVNGDGFADVLIMAYQETPSNSGLAAAGA
jgi:hypothetical protein